MQNDQITVAIIGAGAAGLIAADRLSAIAPDISIKVFDAMPSPARKVLMAGKSGLNISHKSGIGNPASFAQKYGDAAERMEPMLAAFGTQGIMDWMDGLEQEHFVGSSNRIFPKVMKASPLVRAVMKRLEARGVTLATRHRWIGWNSDGALLFTTPEGEKAVEAQACLLALGGPSWPKLGTDGKFLEPLSEQGIASAPYQPANCGFDVNLPLELGKDWAGTPVKSVGLSFAGRTVVGDVMISLRKDASVPADADEKVCSLEGGLIYLLSKALREAINENGSATLSLDLRPNLSEEQVRERLDRPRGKQSFSNHLRRCLKLQGVQAALLKTLTDKSVMSDSGALAAAIKALPVTVIRPRPIEEAISTAGGILFSEMDEDLMVKRKPGLFIAGEILDWEAPTGGYLLTGCLSQGYHAAEGIARYLSASHEASA
nr:TIGR03862 family flavoprotein [uncultured Cohaesibacter sp.]